MKVSSVLVLWIVCASFLSLGLTSNADYGSEQDFKWYTWEEAIAANAKEKKKIFIDIYTGWCGWCKRMDKTTFQHPDVVAYLAEHFYSVKFDAESKRTITYNDTEFKYVQAGRRGVNTLAYSLLEGRMSYPSVVYLNEKEQRIMISPGYKGPKDFLKELKYIAEEQYTKGVSLQQYLQQGG